MNAGKLRVVAITACLLGFSRPSSGQDLDEQVRNLGSTDVRVQSQAVQSVQKASVSAAPALIAGLKDTNPRTRLQCFKYLRSFHSQDDLDAISNAAIKEDDFLAQQYGVMAIASFRSAAAVDRLKKIFEATANLNIRVVALREIASISGKDAISWLTSVLNDAHQALLVRANVARELARLGDSSGHSVAVDALHDSLALTREAGIQAIGLIGKQSDVSTLESKTRDSAESERTKLLAKEALQHLSLVNLPKSQRTDSLEKSLSDGHAWIRAWAAGELAEQGDSRARALLESAAAQAKHPGQREAENALRTMQGH